MPDLDSFIKELLDRKKVDNYILELSERVTSETALKELLLLARETDQLAKVLSTKNSKQVDISCGEILQQVFLTSSKDYLHNPGRRFIKALSIEATRRIQLAGNKRALEEEFSEAPTTPKDLNKTPWSFGESQEIYRCPSCLSIKITKKDLGFRCPQCFEKLPADLEPSYREKENAFGRQRPRTSPEVSARKEANSKTKSEARSNKLRCAVCGSRRTKIDPINAGRLVCARCRSRQLEFTAGPISDSIEGDAEFLKRMGAVMAISLITMLAIIIPAKNQHRNPTNRADSNSRPEQFLTPTRTRRFKDIKSIYDYLSYISESEWDIQSYDELRNEWTNNGRVRKEFTSSPGTFIQKLSSIILSECSNLSPGENIRWQLIQIVDLKRVPESDQESLDHWKLSTEQICQNTDLTLRNYFIDDDITRYYDNQNPIKSTISLPSEFFSSAISGSWVTFTSSLTHRTDGSVSFRYYPK